MTRRRRLRAVGIYRRRLIAGENIAIHTATHTPTHTHPFMAHNVMGLLAHVHVHVSRYANTLSRYCSFDPRPDESHSVLNVKAGETYILILTNYANVDQNLVAEIDPNNTAGYDCQDVIDILQPTGPPPTSPTPAPTDAPTVSPTAGPTDSPTPAPNEKVCECWSKPDVIACPLVRMMNYDCDGDVPFSNYCGPAAQKQGETECGGGSGIYNYECDDEELGDENSQYILWNLLVREARATSGKRRASDKREEKRATSEARGARREARGARREARGARPEARGASDKRSPCDEQRQLSDSPMTYRNNRQTRQRLAPATNPEATPRLASDSPCVAYSPWHLPLLKHPLHQLTAPSLLSPSCTRSCSSRRCTS